MERWTKEDEERFLSEMPNYLDWKNEPKDWRSEFLTNLLGKVAGAVAVAIFIAVIVGIMALFSWLIP